MQQCDEFNRLHRDRTKQDIEILYRFNKDRIISGKICPQSQMIVVPESMSLIVSGVCIIKNTMHIIDYSKNLNTPSCTDHSLPGIPIVKAKDHYKFENFQPFPQIGEPALILNNNKFILQNIGTFPLYNESNARFIGNGVDKIGQSPFIKLTSLYKHNVIWSDKLLVHLHEYYTCNLGHWERDISFLANIQQLNTSIPGIDVDIFMDRKTNGIILPSCGYMLNITLTIPTTTPTVMRETELNVCYKTAAIRYAKRAMFTETNVMYRSTAAHMCKFEQHPPNTVVVVYRAVSSRRWSDQFMTEIMKFVKDWATKRGYSFRLEDYAKLSICDQIKLTNQAVIFLAVHGQILGHLIHLQPKATFIEVISPFKSQGSLWPQRSTMDFNYVTMVSNSIVNVNNDQCQTGDDYYKSESCRYHLTIDELNIVFEKLQLPA